MQEKTNRILLYYVLPALLALALIAVAWWGRGQKAAAARHQNAVEAMYRRAYGELCEDLYEMESALTKLQAVSSVGQRILLLDDVWRLSGSAASSLGQLPLSHPDTREINQFVVRLGDYAHALTKKILNGEPLDAADGESLGQLRASCSQLAQLSAQRLAAGDLPLSSLDGEGYYAAAQSPAGPGDTAEDPDGLLSFPTLIYDGPFAQSAEKRQPQGLQGPEITEEEALALAQSIAGLPLASNGLVEGDIPAYDFSYRDESGAWAEIEIARQGGALLWYMRPASGTAEGRPAQEEARRYRDAALQKLDALGFADMEATYAQYYGGAALINCAATEDDILLYSDLIKVWVDRETLEVIGIDARNYLFSHVERDLPPPSLSQEEAEAKVAPRLEIHSRALALIPLTPQTEALCYEFKCTLGQDSYILYINAHTGAEEQIFRIIDSEDGTLVI